MFMLFCFFLFFLAHSYLTSRVLKRNNQQTILSIDGTLISSTTLGKSGPGSNSNKWVLHTPQSSRSDASPPSAF